MADSVIPPIVPIGTIQPTAANVSNQADQTAATFPIGTAISGFVINRDADNNPIIRTAQGDVTIQSNLFLKTGSEVVFQAAPALSSGFQILSIDHLTPTDYAALTTRGVPADSIIPSELEPPLPLPTTVGITPQPVAPAPQPILQSVVLQASPNAPAATPQVLTQLPAGTAITLTLLDVELPPIPVAVASLPDVATIAHLLPAAQAQTPVANLATPQPISNAVNAALNAGNATYAQAAFAGAVAPVLTSAVAPTANTFAQPTLSNIANTPVPSASSVPVNQPITTTPNTALTPAIPGQVFQATVIGHGEDGLNIVQTNFATLKIYTAQPLPTGTTLQVQAQVAPTVTPPLIAAFTERASLLPPPPTNFTYLTQVLQQLTTQDPSAARTLMQQLPVIGPQFTSGLLFFLAAVKNGTLNEPLQNNRATKAIDALTPGVLSHFAKDVEDLNQNFTQSPLQDWKSVTLPLVFGHEMQPARLYIRDEAGGDNGTVGPVTGGQRFVLDVNFSEIGQIQFDGFIRQGATVKSFELYLRSSEALESDLSQNIRQIFENTTQATGLTGNIVFQAGSEHFIAPQRKPLAPETGDGARTILA